jgi:hypothetical protein
VRYVRGESLKAIEEATGVNRRQLYRSLEHALAPHLDGRIFGYRGLIKHVRITDYARVKAVHIQGERGSCGASGALSQLFERQPALIDWLKLQIKQRRVLLEQISTDGKLRTRLRGLQSLHEEFLRQCRSAGLTAGDYPFNTAGCAIRSVSQRVKAEKLRSFGEAARSAGASRLKGLPPRDREAGSCVATRPYQVVEFDGHRLDVRLKVVVRDPLGFEHEFEIERVWLLVLIDFEYFVKGSLCELGIIQRQQRFKVADHLRRELPLPRLMSVRQGVLDRVFGELVLLHRLVTIPSTLQIPTQVHRAHQFIDQMAVAMSVAACNQRKMTGQRPFTGGGAIHRQ